MRAIFLRFFLFVLLPLVAIFSYAISITGLGLPQVDGELTVKGAKNNIRLLRDDRGAVYIDATSDHDAFFGLGVAHAQDRLWQLELQRRIAKGKLSEVLGESSVKVDAQMRTLDLYRTAKRDWFALSAEARESLTAYTAGINTMLTDPKSLPLEFKLLGVTPEPWTEVDSLAWSKVFALSLSNSMWSEIRRFLSLPYLNDEQRAELFLGYPEEQATALSPTSPMIRDTLAAMVQLQDEVEQRFKIGGDFVGSNAWVISGKLTNDGNTILANDPHLGIQIPSLWYVATLTGDKLNASGMTLVGLPVIVFGRNQHIAWGGTNMMADVQDLYFEQDKNTDAGMYTNTEHGHKFETEKQYINVRPKFPSAIREAIKPVEIEIRKSVRGPIVSDVFGLSDRPISLQWTALNLIDTTYESFFRLNYASNWDAFKGALKHHVSPTLNFLYSDTEGNIGYQAAGKIPIRAKGNGDIPVLASTGENHWIGYIPFDEMPRSYNPKEGFIVSANNKMVDDSYPYHISYDWAPDARATRIRQLIEQEIQTSQLLSIDYMEKMQGDTLSHGAANLLTILKSAPMATERQKMAQEYIASWNGDMSVDSQAASIFYSWSRHLRIVLFANSLKPTFGRAQHDSMLKQVYMNSTYDQIAVALSSGGAQWCDGSVSREVESCDWAIQASLDMTLKQLTKLAGSDMDDWTWGRIHNTVYRHTLFSDVNLVKSFFERRVASGGGPDSINVSVASYVESKGFEQYFGAGFRQVMSLGEKSITHRYVNSTGQSENVFSKHYDDLVKPFSELFYLELRDNTVANELLLKNTAK